MTTKVRRLRLSYAAFLLDEPALVTYEWPVALLFGAFFLGMAIHFAVEAPRVAAIATEVTTLAPAQRAAVLAHLDAKTRDRVEAILVNFPSPESWTGAQIEDLDGLP